MVTARALRREFHRYVSFSCDPLGAALFVADARGNLRLESGDADVGGTEAGPHLGNSCESSQTPRRRLQSLRHFQGNDSRHMPYRRDVPSRCLLPALIAPRRSLACIDHKFLRNLFHYRATLMQYATILKQPVCKFLSVGVLRGKERSDQLRFMRSIASGIFALHHRFLRTERTKRISSRE